jgi:hypothetical protein
MPRGEFSMAKQELYEYEVRNNADIETPAKSVRIGMDIRDITKQIYLSIYWGAYLVGAIYFSFFDTPICLMILPMLGLDNGI